MITRASFRSSFWSLSMLAFVGGTRARRYGEKAHLSSCALLALSSRDVMELNPKRRAAVSFTRLMMRSSAEERSSFGVRAQPRYL